MSTKLHLENPATEWENGSPVGCGSLGAMLFGGTGKEQIYLTEETIWSSNPPWDGDPEFRVKIEKIRDMFRNGNLENIDEKTNELLGNSMRRIGSLEYAGKIEIFLPGYDTEETIVKEYSRDLLLDKGMFECSYLIGDNKISEEAFCSYPKRVFALKYDFSKGTDLIIRYERENLSSLKYIDREGYVDPEYSIPSSDFSCGFFAEGSTVSGGHRFAVASGVRTDGDVEATESCIKIHSAKELVLFAAAATEYRYGNGFLSKASELLPSQNYFEIKEEHIQDFSSLFYKSDISVNSSTETEKLPFDKRLQRLIDTDENDPDARAYDPGLYSLYFNFGKYLLISSSRPGTLPANLQGVWVEKLENPWGSDYHTNINLQMNYWPAETANIPECHYALFDYMNTLLLPFGERVARESYKCGGTVTHHLSDIYGYTAPADGVWGLWPHGAGWLSTHMWEHFLFTLDVNFLHDTAYDFIKQCAVFYMDYMFEGPDGRIYSGPSDSPENSYYLPTSDGGRQSTQICFSPTMDIEIISSVLRHFIDASNILGLDSDLADRARYALDKMPGLRTGPDGRLNEWLEPYDEPEPGHRHISHAFGLYPEHLINDETPELKDAIRKTLHKRLSCGGGHTGWSRAWLICLFARLGDEKEAGEHFRKLLVKSTKPNMLDNHPPFQIDGNFGGAAGIAEMLLQSSMNADLSDPKPILKILPALPDDCPDGSFRDLAARGGFLVSAEWKHGKVVSCTVRGQKNIPFRLEFNGETVEGVGCYSIGTVS